MTGTLPVLVAPDKFKGTLAAAKVAAAIARGVRRGGLEAIELPVADGGEGTASALLSALGGKWCPFSAHDAVGRTVAAEVALLGDGGTAVVEVAAASGLWRLSPTERDAFGASSRGTGELIASATALGVDEVIVAAGGSATTDGGAGALAALDEAGVEVRLTVVCDVRTPFELAPREFGPQKGAAPDHIRRLERRLARLARGWPRDPRGVPMTGAAGGLAGGLWAARGARLVPGAPFVLDALGFDDAARGARFVVTGEGRLDPTTLAGKAVGEVATRCRQGGIACHAVVGEDALDAFEARILDLASITEAGDQRALAAAGRALTRATAA